MEWTIKGAEGFATLDFNLNSGEAIRSQPRAMVSMTTGIEITATIGGDVGKGGALAGVKGMLAGESFANSTFTSKRDGELLTLAPDTIGPILPILLNGNDDLMIAKGAYLACEPGVVINVKYGGVKSLLARKGLYLLRATGCGHLFLTGAGEIRFVTLNKDQRLAIDNEYVVAFDSSVQYAVVTAAKGLKDSFLSGEGVINRYTGPGKIYFQTRSRQRAGVLSTVLNTLN